MDNDLKIYLTGASSDGGLQSDPDLSLGNYRSSVELVDAITENLFNNLVVPGGGTFYRCLCIKNENNIDSLIAPVIWFDQSNTGLPYRNSLFAIEVPTGSDTVGKAQVIGDEITSPVVGGGNVSSWSVVTNKLNGVGLNQGVHGINLGPNEIVFIWLTLSWISLGPDVLGEYFRCRIEEN